MAEGPDHLMLLRIWLVKDTPESFVTFKFGAYCFCELCFLIMLFFYVEHFEVGNFRLVAFFPGLDNLLGLAALDKL